MNPLPFASALHLASLIREGHETSEGLTTAYLERIERHNPTLHAIVQRNGEGALREARERDANRGKDPEHGPLHGVPVTVKEAFDMEGFRTTVNFPQLKNNVADTDALVVRRLLEG